jgi:eukaryotic-like serine/threonine-protein kinase
MAPLYFFAMESVDLREPNSVSHTLPAHLQGWQLPPSWRWGGEGIWEEHRHSQEVIDVLGRSLALVSAPNPDHAAWLEAEASVLGHRSHPSIPTTFHYWQRYPDSPRGPGYLRRWIVGETIGARFRRTGFGDIPLLIQVLRSTGSALAYLHDTQLAAGAISSETVWITPTGRIWLLGWQWIVPRAQLPAGLEPRRDLIIGAPEWRRDGDQLWEPTAASDQWQLAALCFEALTGELPPPEDIPPLRLASPECPKAIADVLDRALQVRPENRYRSMAAMLREVDRLVGPRTMIVSGGVEAQGGVSRVSGGYPAVETTEGRLRWAVGEDYEVLAPLGSGRYGSVWRVRDLSLGREVALKMLHPHVARDLQAGGQFRREARLAAQLSHHAVVPIYDWDTRGDVSWYTMELAEGGSLAELVSRSGPRPLEEVVPQVGLVLSGLAAGHALGIVHRDLKPENILVDRYNRWQIADFGIANVTGDERMGTTGTPAFAAPEQLLGEAVGVAADCFSLAGVVLFVLSGELPFGGGDPQSILARQLAGTVDLRGYPRELADWLRRGFSPDPEKRYQDAADMEGAWHRAVEAMEQRRYPWWRQWLRPEGRGIAAELD